MAFNLPPGCGRLPDEDMRVDPPLAYICDHCGSVVGDPHSSRLISVSREDASDPPHAGGYIHVAQCPDCGHQKKFYSETEDPVDGFGSPMEADTHEVAIAEATGKYVLDVASSWAEVPEFAQILRFTNGELRYPWQIAEVGTSTGDDGAFEPESTWVLVPMENWKIRYDRVRRGGSSSPPEVLYAVSDTKIREVPH